ncbi:BatD family protein [soil metagenome]
MKYKLPDFYKLKSCLILFIAALFSFSSTFSQEVSIELGSDEIAVNEVFTITISIQNEKIRTYDNFPEIPGFSKRGTSSSSSTNIINGQLSSSHSITQNYVASEEGVFTLKPFFMTINDEIHSAEGKTINVGPPMQSRRQRDPFNSDPFEEFFGNRREMQEYVDVEDDAFLALSTDKEQVYLGEGINIVFAFYVADANRAPLQFYDLGRQLSDILKTLKPANCWEENFNIDNISGTPVVINNKNYQQYKIYQAVFYPLNTDPVKFPSVGLEMIKYKVAKSQSFFGQNKQESYKTFHSRPKTVTVLDLPPHPLKNQVSVGNFRLKEKISDLDLRTGLSFGYEFSISGEGNISGIEPPKVQSDEHFEFYPPNSKININRSGNRVTGHKTFSYNIIPNEPGNYDIDKYFKWIFFNPQTHNYDTLRSEYAVMVTGESKKNEQILSHDLGNFYDIIELESNVLVNRKQDDFLKMFANIFILAMLVLTAVFIFRK